MVRESKSSNINIFRSAIKVTMNTWSHNSVVNIISITHCAIFLIDNTFYVVLVQSFLQRSIYIENWDDFALVRIKPHALCI